MSARTRDRLMLTGMMVAGAILVAVSLITVLSEGPRDPVAASTADGEGPHAGPVRTASVSGLDEAARDLDLIRPPRPKQASDFTVSLLGGETLKLTFPVTLDTKMDLANVYGVRALPASFLIDRNGYLTALALGPRPWDNRAAHALVEGMLAQ